ncbi:MAG: DUF4363 family protein [Ruminococcaceae bacterium]|nr:DUF4363 family protein [Oscillospiraceae bacterium]
MKKAVFALSLLIFLSVVSLWNLRHLETLTRDLIGGVESARAYWQAGDFDSAENTLEKTLDRWLGADGYTHIFIRHSEIDAASDIFYDLRGDILAGDEKSADANAQKLLYHLQSIYSMEQISLKSVF